MVRNTIKLMMAAASVVTAVATGVAAVAFVVQAVYLRAFILTILFNS